MSLPIILLLISVVKFTCAFHTLLLNNGLSPVILVPGDGGSQVLAKWHKDSSPSYICSKEEDSWYQLWLNLEELTPLTIECLTDNLKLNYNNDTRTTNNTSGVQITVKDFGNSSAVEWLSPSHHSYSNYFSSLVEKLIPLGYDRKSSIRGAPFDFRKAPNELHDYFSRLQTLIEEAFKQNGQKVTLIAHSMGAPVLHYFLLHRDKKWKDNYIQAVISLSGAWGGSVKAVKVFAAGYGLDSYLISSLKMRTLQRSQPSLAFLLPSENVWGRDEIFVRTPLKNYSISSFEQYFHDIGFRVGYEMYLDTRNLLYKSDAPGVEIHCLFGIGVDTTESFGYSDMSKFPDYPDIIFPGDGDGTVNLRSSLLCNQFSKMQDETVTLRNFTGVNHMDILQDDQVHQYIVDYLKKVQFENLRNVKKNRRRPHSVEENNSIDGWKNYIPLFSRSIS